MLTLDRYYAQREGGKPLRTLFGALRAKSLRRLHLGAQGITEAGLVAIIESKHLTGLEWLSVSAGEMTDAAAEALLDSPTFRGLRGGSFVAYRMSERWRERLKTRFPNATV